MSRLTYCHQLCSTISAANGGRPRRQKTPAERCFAGAFEMVGTTRIELVTPAMSTADFVKQLNDLNELKVPIGAGIRPRLQLYAGNRLICTRCAPEPFWTSITRVSKDL
jgi:hypothetical protein